MMNGFVETLNLWFGRALPYVWPMLWQSSLLIVGVFALDLALRRKSRAAVRYALWLVVLLKMLLPPSFAFPSGAAWWLRGRPATTEPKPRTASLVVSYRPAITPAPRLDFTASAVDFPTAKPHLSTAGWMVGTSASISLALLGWMLLRWCRVARRARRASTAPASLKELLAATRRQMRLPLGVRIKLTEAPISPAVCGLFFPIILFPRALAERLSSTQLSAVLMHELFHLKRGDVWVNLLQTLLQLLYWWHPLLWLANARIRLLREEAVDDCVMLALRDDAETYAPTLLEVAKMTLRRPLASLGLVGIVESKSLLRHRIERLLNFRRPNRAGLTVQSLAGIFAFSALAVPMGQAPERPRQALNDAQSQADPSPDSRLPGYLEIDLDAQFFSAESSMVQAFLPSLLQNNRLMVIGANDLAAVQTGLQRASVRPIAEGEPLHFQKFSGGRYHYRVGGVTSNFVNYEVKPSSEGGPTISARIELVSALPEWVPIEFTLSPLSDTESVRCQMELTPAEQPSVLEQAEASIPPGGALLWAASEELASGKCQLVLLTRSATENGADRSTGHGPLPSAKSAASDLAPLRDWLERHKAKQGAVAWTNLAGPALGADSPIAVQDHPDPFRGPGRLGDRQLILQQFKTAGYNLPETIVDEVVREHATGRQAILAMLDHMRLDKGWAGLPLSEVVKDLSAEVAKRDPKKKGINFLITPNVNFDAPTPIDLVSGLPVAAGTSAEPVAAGTSAEPVAAGTSAEPVDAGEIRITINPPLTDVRLIDLLDAIVKGADKPIKYSIEKHAVEFSMVSRTGIPPLFLRTFKIDLETLRLGLRKALEGIGQIRTAREREAAVDVFGRTNETAEILGELREFLLMRGVDLRPPKSLFYGDREGTLLVRATLQDLDIIEEALQNIKNLEAQHEVHSRHEQGPAVTPMAPILTQTNGLPDAAQAKAPQQISEPGQLLRPFTLQGSGDSIVEYSLDSGLVVATNGAVVTFGGARLTADTIHLDQRSGEVLAEGKAVLQRSGRTWTGDRIRYNTKTLEIESEQYHTNESPGADFGEGSHANDLQVYIKIKFVEIGDGEARYLLDGLRAPIVISLVTNSTSPSIAEGTVPMQHQDLYGIHPPTNAAVVTGKGILSDPQYRVLLHALEQREGVDLLSDASVTTLSGRQTQVQAVDELTVVTAPGWTPQTPSTSTNLYRTERVAVGPVLDVTPHIERDGFSIKLTVVGTVTEFLGYDDPRQVVSNAVAHLPLPHFRFRQLSTSEQLFDGQTLMLVGLVKEEEIKGLRDKAPGLGGPPHIGRKVQSESSPKSRKHLLIFITPTLIDPAGNRVHSDSEIEQPLPRPK